MRRPAAFVVEIAPASAPAVSVQLAIEPDEQLTTDWLRQLIANARASAAREKEAA